MEKPSQLAKAYGIVSIETNFAVPSKEELARMARRRFQDPKPKIEGYWWYIRPWQDEIIGGRRVRTAEEN